MSENPPWGPPPKQAHFDLILGRHDSGKIVRFLAEEARRQEFGSAQPGSTPDELLTVRVNASDSGIVLSDIGRSQVIPRIVSKEFQATVVSFSVLYSQTWICDLHRDGEYLDRHWSCPERGGVPDSKDSRKRYLDSWLGVPEVFGKVFGLDLEVVRPYLRQLTVDQIETSWTNAPLAEKNKAHPDDEYTLAGGWAWLDLLRRSGRADLGESCILSLSQYQDNPAPVELKDILRSDLLDRHDYETWRPPSTKPGANESRGDSQR